MQFIDGAFCDGTGETTIQLINPATGAAILGFASASPADVEKALHASAKGFSIWKAETPKARQKVLAQAAALIAERCEEIASDLTRESGKPIKEARIEVNTSAEILSYYAEEAKRVYGRLVPAVTPGLTQRVIHDPVGPVVAMVAWNFPAVNYMRKVAASLAAGCSVTIKPSEETPLTGLHFARAFQDAGLPAGVLNVVYGNPAAISQQMCASDIPRKLSFTGSVPVGRELIKLASENLIRTTMELGGHAPFIVFEDADIDHAANLMVAGKFRNAGQVCVSPSRFLVHESVHDAFVARVIENARKLKIGDGLDETTDMGPLANVRRREAMEHLLSDALNKGASLLWQGAVPDSEGFYFAPAILGNIAPDSLLLTEEIFGPIAPIVTFASVDEAIEMANSVPYGLAAYAFTSDQGTLRRVGDEIHAGMTAINTLQVASPETPFGGLGWSGWGSDGGPEGLSAFLSVRLVNEALAPGK
ncbi:succinate-semialdehyde dehydrogenase / glutarate-semialdehyde dehydrogenase [Cognatishimia maritima]|uniref:Succinate-semialdehyde dehydrogenase / glutarate-semialdehyde dehydrogenase n=2 Tax=Cognatishimia maritima TaxID=870908 RepID=A0A1M5QWU7_9RHOB|nr:succinate-semialdehyde dehydrogenase / glutarate-semialdehyde dehydrogenase [Cognatishimia maritima]